MFDSNHLPKGKIVKDPAFDQAGIQVFDYHDETSQEDARVWVVEQSRLPIRIQVTNSRSGSVTQATFDYSDTQPAGFFDLEAFKKKPELSPPNAHEAYENHFAADDIAAWYKLASQWRQPPTDLKYSENPADATANKPFLREYKHGERKIRTGSFNTGPVDRIPLYDAKGKPVLQEITMIFAHERTSTTGINRVVGITEPTFDGTRLSLVFWEVEPSGDTYKTVRSGTTNIDMAGICGPGEIRLFAGQPDPKDASRFSIPFECKASKGWIDCIFKEGAIECSVRKSNTPQIIQRIPRDERWTRSGEWRPR